MTPSLMSHEQIFSFVCFFIIKNSVHKCDHKWIFNMSMTIHTTPALLHKIVSSWGTLFLIYWQHHRKQHYKTSYSTWYMAVCALNVMTMCGLNVYMQYTSKVFWQQTLIQGQHHYFLLYRHTSHLFVMHQGTLILLWHRVIATRDITFQTLGQVK